MISFLTFFTLVLGACNPAPNENTESDEQGESTQTTQGNTNVVSENQLGTNFYRPALDADGRYQTSKNRGVTLNLNSGINIALFEKDLMRLSQDLFPTDDYFMQEGQILSESLVSSWLGRQSEDNPDGLNPAEAGEGDNRAPRYLNSILEFDFLSPTDGGSELAGISIGLAMNSVDYYPAYQFGPTLEQEIPADEMLAQGQQIADEIVTRIRNFDEEEMPGMADLPIYIGIYSQTSQDNLAGGTYIAEGQSTNGSTTVENWENINEERLIFPLQGRDSAEGNAFANFQSEVESFFPNLSGITGRAHYVDDTLISLTIDIMTQFYGETEMVSFTQYLKQSATTFLPADIDVEIIVESPGNVEAFLKRDRTENEYFSYVFD